MCKASAKTAAGTPAKTKTTRARKTAKTKQARRSPASLASGKPDAEAAAGDLRAAVEPKKKAV